MDFKYIKRTLCTMDGTKLSVMNLIENQKLTLQRSTRSLSAMMSTDRGSCPAGAFSGIS